LVYLSHSNMLEWTMLEWTTANSHTNLPLPPISAAPARHPPILIMGSQGPIHATASHGVSQKLVTPNSWKMTSCSFSRQVMSLDVQLKGTATQLSLRPSVDWLHILKWRAVLRSFWVCRAVPGLCVATLVGNQFPMGQRQQWDDHPLNELWDWLKLVVNWKMTSWHPQSTNSTIVYQ